MARNAAIDSAEIIRRLEEASKYSGAVARHEGDAERVLASAGTAV